jgi:hypothetical protein
MRGLGLKVESVTISSQATCACNEGDVARAVTAKSCRNEAKAGHKNLKVFGLGRS